MENRLLNKKFGGKILPPFHIIKYLLNNCNQKPALNFN